MSGTKNNMTEQDKKKSKMEFENVSWFHRTFWPIYGDENKKFIPMAIMMACALFTYTCLRITKDSLVLTAPGATGITLSYLKTFCVLPASFVFIGIFMYLSKKLSKEQLFFVTLVPFVTFFLLFSLVLYPNISYLHASESWVLAKQAAYPRFTDLIPVFAHWVYSMFYVMAELWGNVVITFLFWGFASYVVAKNQRDRFFQSCAVYGNFGLIAASYLQEKIAVHCIQNGIKESSKEYLKLTSFLFYIIIFAISLFALCYWYINTYVLPNDNKEVSDQMKIKPKANISFLESIKLIFQSKYLLFICLIVLAYGVSINLVEITWKGVVKQLYCNKISCDLFFSRLYRYVGLSTLVLGVFAQNCVERFGWKKTALVTPVMLMITASLFFVFLIFGQYFPSIFLFGFTSLQIAVFLGTLQNVLSKATKYILFDPTTQLAYVPLPEELRLNGKAAVDIIGGRAGKSIGSLFQGLLGFVLKGGQGVAIAPYLFPVTSLLVVGWIYSANCLSVLYEEAQKKKAEESDENNVKEVEQNLGVDNNVK